LRSGITIKKGVQNECLAASIIAFKFSIGAPGATPHPAIRRYPFSPTCFKHLGHRENGVAMQLDDRYANPAFTPDNIEQVFSTITPNQFLFQIAPQLRLSPF
jgi:hypothetical protein